MKVHQAVLCAAIGLVAIPLPSYEVAAQESKLALIRMAPAELAAHGISVRELRTPPFPNSCQVAGNPRLSVSNEFLAHFKARGFSLESLCLGISSHIHFDPETGRQLPLVHLPELARSRSANIPLNLPDCFRNAVPYLECNVKYDTWEFYRLKPDEIDRQSAIKLDALVRKFIESRQFSGVFQIQALGQGIFDSRYEWLLASPALQHGYGYALHGPEGDDPESEEVDLSTYRKKVDVGLPWNVSR
ncbi:hypothetical protein [Bradyrhizobium sp. Bra78]|uniref:hypothetical protein n=1 Tax=Bradyrhizobium sp. Bra78 TaxID=2926010 RepID=UPI0021C64F67|nr:hypothetical protein [Bradyrhizobium sp. Bra78]